MTRPVVVPFRRHQRPPLPTQLDRLLEQVAIDSRPFAADLLCVRNHPHEDGGCIGAPRGYWPQLIPSEPTPLGGVS